MTATHRAHRVCLAALAWLLMLGGCGSSDVPSDQAGPSAQAGAGGTSSGGAGAGGASGSGGADCVAKPTTHVEIINACTNAQAVDVSPVLPLLPASGELPPLP